MKYGEQSQTIQFNNTGILASMGYQSTPHEPWQYALILMKCLLKINNIEHDYNRFTGLYDEIDHFYTATMTKITYDHFYTTLVAQWYNENVPEQITECNFEDFDTIVNTIDEYKTLYNYLTLYLN
jgi:protein-tyrosine phosphatase